MTSLLTSIVIVIVIVIVTYIGIVFPILGFCALLVCAPQVQAMYATMLHRALRSLCIVCVCLWTCLLAFPRDVVLNWCTLSLLKKKASGSDHGARDEGVGRHAARRDQGNGAAPRGRLHDGR